MTIVNKILIYILIKYNIYSNDIYELILKYFQDLSADLKHIHSNNSLIINKNISPIEQRNAIIKNIGILQKHNIESQEYYDTTTPLPSLFSLAASVVNKKRALEKSPWYAFWTSISDYEKKFSTISNDIRQEIEKISLAVSGDKALQNILNNILYNFSNSYIFDDTIEVNKLISYLFSDICEIKRQNNLQAQGTHGFYLMGIVAMLCPSKFVEELLQVNNNINYGLLITEENFLDKIFLSNLNNVGRNIMYTPLKLAATVNNHSCVSTLFDRGGIFNINDLLEYTAENLNMSLTSRIFAILNNNNYTIYHDEARFLRKIVSNCQTLNLDIASQLIELYIFHNAGIYYAIYDDRDNFQEYRTIEHDLYENNELTTDSKEILKIHIRCCYLCYKMTKDDLTNIANKRNLDAFFIKQIIFRIKNDSHACNTFLKFSHNKEDKLPKAQCELLKSNIAIFLDSNEIETETNSAIKKNI